MAALHAARSAPKAAMTSASPLVQIAAAPRATASATRHHTRQFGSQGGRPSSGGGGGARSSISIMGAPEPKGNRRGERCSAHCGSDRPLLGAFAGGAGLLLVGAFPRALSFLGRLATHHVALRPFLLRVAAADDVGLVPVVLNVVLLLPRARRGS